MKITRIAIYMVTLIPKTRPGKTAQRKIALAIIILIFSLGDSKSQTFTEQEGIYHQYTEYSYQSLSFGDYDNDGDKDILIPIDRYEGSAIYINQLNEGFSRLVGTNFPELRKSSNQWGDYNNDGFLDLLVSGDRNCKIYKNTAGAISDTPSVDLGEVESSSSRWGDFDNDGDLDLFIIGEIKHEKIAKIYLNQGNDVFQEKENINILPASSYFSSLGDFNGDGFVDLIYTGMSNEGYRIKLYQNDLRGGFLNVDSVFSFAYILNSVDWGDYDNDGDLDLLSSELWRNDGNGIFTIQDQNPSFESDICKWGDFNNDGFLDIITYGGKLLLNDKSGGFYENTQVSFISKDKGSVYICDYDNDSDLDLFFTGEDANGYLVTRIYRNNIEITNNKPTPPDGVYVEVVGDKAKIYWERATDDETDSKGLSYNIQIGSTEGGSDIRDPMSLADGTRKIVERGMIQDTVWTINHLDVGEYFVKVQAIDHSFVGSAFSEEIPFYIASANSISPIAQQTIKPDTFGDTIFAEESSPMDGREWRYSHNMGGPYEQIIEGELGLSLIPRFLESGVYFIVCVSHIENVSVVSNEVKIEVPRFSKSDIITESMSGGKTSNWADFDSDGRMDLVLSGYQNGESYTKLFRNYPDSIRIQAWMKETAHNSLNVIDIFDADNDLDLDILQGDRIFLNQNDTFLLSESFDYIKNGDSDWADYDNDGDIDLIVSGLNENDKTRIYLYENISNTRYEKQQIEIPAISEGEILSGDFNNDGRLDILVTGLNFSGNRFAKIYRNLGENRFTALNNNLEVMSFSHAALGDINCDGNLDIAITGYSSNTQQKVKVYLNNSNGQFTEIHSQDHDVYRDTIKNIELGDLDNDGYLDVVYTSLSKTEILIFSTDSTFIEDQSVYRGGQYSNLVDYDNDGDLDLFICGNDSSELFENNFLIANENPEPPNNLRSVVKGGEVELIWDTGYDPDTDTVGLSYNLYVTDRLKDKIYVTPLANLLHGQKETIGIGNAGYIHSFILEGLSPGTYFWAVQSVDQCYSASEFSVLDSFTVLEAFTEVDFLDGERGMRGAFGDINKDDLLDIIISGDDKIYIYINKGDGSFLKDMGMSFPVLYPGTIDMNDYDNDGDLDLLIADVLRLSEGQKIIIFRNDDGTFVGNTIVDSEDRVVQSASWGDFNNDGMIDILATGWYYSKDSSRVYTNIGNDEFILTEGNKLIGIVNGLGSSVDYNNDARSDILISGLGVAAHFTSSLNKNINDGGFQSIESVGIEPVWHCSHDWADINSDGFLDLLITGADSMFNNTAQVFLNGKNDKFINAEVYIKGITRGAGKFCDFDNDGDLDISLSGESGPDFTEIFRNDGNLRFTELENGFIPGIYSSIDWGDYDFDGDLDFLLTSRYDTKLYRNNGNYGNTPPSAPSDLLVTRNQYETVLSWTGSNDDQTPAQSLSYNIRIGSFPGGRDIVSPLANSESGVLMKPGLGNCFLNTKYVIDSLPAGRYYWSVQSLDNIYHGSNWAPEKSFDITSLWADFSADTACLGSATSFIDKSVPQEKIEGWTWDFGDGSSIQTRDPQYVFTEAGIHNVTLKIERDGTFYSVTKDVHVSTVPAPSFDVSNTCRGELTQITNTSVIDAPLITNWNWDFGDESSSTKKDPSQHGYLNAGSYIIRLSADADNGCSGFSEQTIEIIEIPEPETDIIVTGDLCDQSDIRLEVSEKKGYTYDWTLEGNAIPDADTNIIAPPQEGIYRVTVHSNCGQSTGEFELDYGQSLPKPEIIIEGPNVWYLACSYDSADIYNWYYNGELINNARDYIYVANQQLGDYQVEIGNMDTECLVKSDKVTIPLTMISKLDPWENLKIYPNPTPGLFTLEMDNPIMGELIIDIVGGTGQRVVNIKFEKVTSFFKTQIDLSEQPASLYLIGLMLNEYQTTRSLIVE